MQTGYKKWNAFNFHVPEESYAFPAHVHWWETVPPYLQEASPMRTAHMRAPQEVQTCFGQECFVDEVALAAGADPVEWRLKYIKDPREAAVLKAAAEKFGWQPRAARPAQTGDVVSGRGIILHSGYGSYTSVAVEVEVNRNTGRVWIKRLVVAFDCGLVINPTGIQASLEGQTMQGISRALYEEVHFDDKTVTSVDWMTYRIANLADIPGQMDFVVINRPDKPLGGAGEPAMTGFPAAIANAVADATGVRMRRYPLTPERVKAALA
jgi:CO/xanthine dehydrogenase Mo-binding subunit